MLTEMIRREDTTRVLRVYSLGARLRKTTSVACGAILQVRGKYAVGWSSVVPAMLLDSWFYTTWNITAFLILIFSWEETIVYGFPALCIDSWNRRPMFKCDRESPAPRIAAFFSRLLRCMPRLERVEWVAPPLIVPETYILPWSTICTDLRGDIFVDTVSPTIYPQK